jgi:hypothetical protein
MAKLLKPRQEVKKAIAARIRAGNDLTVKAEIAERTAGYRDWLSLFATWREETIAVLDTLYEEKDIGRELGRQHSNMELISCSLSSRGWNLRLGDPQMPSP